MSRQTAFVADFTERIRGRSPRYALPTAYFTILSLLVFYPLLKPGYVLSLDMIFAPNADYLQFGLHTKGPLYYGRLPLLVALDALALVLDDWVIQKLVLLSIPICAGLSMYAACESRTRTRAAMLFAGTLYAINPFVYVRLLAGHWYFLLGYAFVPLAVVAFDEYVDSESDGSLARAVGWTTLVSVFDPHATVLVALAGCSLWGVRVVSVAWETEITWTDTIQGYVRRFGTFCLVAAAVNAYWLVPAASSTLGGGGQLSSISGTDLTVFSARGTVADNVPLSVAMLYGFWRGAATTTFELLPAWVVGLLFAGVVFCTLTGLVHHWRDSMLRGLALAGAVGFILSLGVSTAVSEPLVRTLFDVVPVLRGMRDTQKFAGLLVLAYAFLGSHGVDALLPDRRLGLATLTHRHDTARLASLTLVALLVVSPLVYTAPMFAGFSGQLGTTTYPASWDDANDVIGTDGTGRALFLPWHQYLTFSWTERRIATPASLYFDRPVVEGRNLEIGGIESHATDPTHTRVREALESPSDPTFGDQLASVGIQYVVVVHEADYRQYDSLGSNSDFSVVFERADITVYENLAFDESDGSWPRTGPRVPVLGLAVGCLVSLGAVALLGRRVVYAR